MKASYFDRAPASSPTPLPPHPAHGSHHVSLNQDNAVGGVAPLVIMAELPHRPTKARGVVAGSFRVLQQIDRRHLGGPPRDPALDLTAALSTYRRRRRPSRVGRRVDPLNPPEGLGDP